MCQEMKFVLNRRLSIKDVLSAIRVMQQQLNSQIKLLAQVQSLSTTQKQLYKKVAFNCAFLCVWKPAMRLCVAA